MRLFVGIPLADPVVRELAAVVARLRNDRSGPRGGSDGLRWTEPESWHITLQFLGNATSEQFECLKARLAEVRSAPAPVRLGELGSFDRAGILFADVAVAPELAALQQRVAAATSECGFVAEARPFHPHITLAKETGSKRARERNHRKSGDQSEEKAGRRGVELREAMAGVGSQPAFTRFVAREFVLYESHLGPDGAKYEIRQRFPLADA